MFLTDTLNYFSGGYFKENNYTSVNTKVKEVPQYSSCKNLIGRGAMNIQNLFNYSGLQNIREKLSNIIPCQLSEAAKEIFENEYGFSSICAGIGYLASRTISVLSESSVEAGVVCGVGGYLFYKYREHQEKQYWKNIHQRTVSLAIPLEDRFNLSRVDEIDLVDFRFQPAEYINTGKFYDLDGQKVAVLTDSEKALANKGFQLQFLGPTHLTKKLAPRFAQMASGLLLHQKIWSDYVPNTLKDYQDHFMKNRQKVDTNCAVLSDKAMFYITNKTLYSLEEPIIKEKFKDIETIGMRRNITVLHERYHIQNQSNHPFIKPFTGWWHVILIGKMKSGEHFAIDPTGLCFLNSTQDEIKNGIRLMQIFVAPSSGELNNLLEKRYFTEKMKWTKWLDTNPEEDPISNGE